MTSERGSVAPPFVVFVVGRPASGKTTVSRIIAERWELPILAKDEIKEILYDSLGVADREWSMRLGRAAFEVLDHVIRLHLQTGRSFLVEGWFHTEFVGSKFLDWLEEFGYQAVQVHCVAPHEHLVRRFAARATDGSRHPGHGDHDLIDGFRDSLDDGRIELLPLLGPVLTYRTDQDDGLDRLLGELATMLGPKR